MENRRWQEIKRLYNSALERRPEDRAAYLDAACRDESLRREVDSLLACQPEAKGFIESPAFEAAARDLARDPGDASAALAGRALSHYTILEKLGAGGMGIVYRAFDTRLNRPVALKVLPPDRVSDPERKLRFLKEARAASALNHPNIVTVYDIDQADGVDFIAMEYVEGKTLDELIGRKGLGLNEALKYAIQVADALARAHAAGIIHRDIKPGNVMVTADGRAKVLDFGLAKLTETASSDHEAPVRAGKPTTEEGLIVGTLSYMSPEQAEGKKVDARSDIFSFGSLLYEMVSGRRAFRGDTNAATLASIIHQAPAPLASDVPRDLEKVVARCLRKDVSRRFQHMEDVKVILEELKEESDSGQLAVAAPPLSRKGLRWRLAAAAAVPLLGVVGWLLWRSVSAPPPSPRVVPLTSYPGSELHPSFSPDGKQVAFAWNGEKQDNFDIYVKLVDSATSLRLTTDPAADTAPAWSPEGGRIAFVRTQGRHAAIYLTTPVGGQARKLADYRPAFSRASISWSPDGKWLAVAELESDGTNGIFLIPVEQGERRRLISGQVSAGRYGLPVLSPDARYVAYALAGGIIMGDVCLLELGPDLVPTGQARRLANRVGYINRVAWTSDGQAVLYGAGQPSGAGLWRVSIAGGARSERVDLAGEGAGSPAVSPTGYRLAYSLVRSSSYSDIWMLHSGPPLKSAISSTLQDIDPQFSPDGRRIAFGSDRSGKGNDIWVANPDGTNAVQLTEGGDRWRGSPRWSPDGRWIAFDGESEDRHWDIFVVDAAGGQPRRLTPYPSDEHLPSWSRDGRWIYFSSNQTGRFEIWRMPSAGGRGVQVTDKGGFKPCESWDGRNLYYDKYEGTALFVRSLSGGQERQILGLESVSSRSFVVMEDGVYYITRDVEGGPDFYKLIFLDLATKERRVLNRFESRNPFGLCVSPDRKTFLYAGTAPGSTGVDLMLIENFR